MGSSEELVGHRVSEDASTDAWQPLATRLAGPHGLRYRVLCVTFTFAILIRALPDLFLLRALPVTLGLLFGAAFIAGLRHALGWALCAASLAASILFYTDQLTQTPLLMLWAIAALLTWPGSPQQRHTRMERDFPAAVGALTIATYTLAAFHKLNTGFLQPETSCANAGLAELALEWGLPVLHTLSAWPAWPFLFLTAELALALLWWLSPHRAVLLALAIHIPLTVVFAPSFVFVMLVGWVALLPPTTLQHALHTARTQRLPILTLGLILATASLSQHTHNRCFSINFDWCLKEALLWLLTVLTLFSLRRLPPAPEPPRLSSRARFLRITLLTLWLLHGLLPYTGLAFHRTGAMLSNLRIDAPCWNHLLVPQSACVAGDPYIYIDRAEFHTAPDKKPRPQAQRRLERQVPKRLWNPQMLWTSRRQWCRNPKRQIALFGSYQSQDFAITDLCGSRGWPFDEPWLPGMRAFQKNLPTACPNRCIH